MKKADDNGTAVSMTDQFQEEREARDTSNSAPQEAGGTADFPPADNSRSNGSSQEKVADGSDFRYFYSGRKLL